MRSSRDCSPSPVIELRGFRRVRLFISIGMLLSLTVVAGSAMPWPACALAAALVLVSGGFEFYCTWSGSRGYVAQLQIGPDGQLLCGFGPDPLSLVPVEVRYCWTLGGLVTGLTVCGASGQCGRVFLFVDQYQPDEWRWLQRCLYLRRG